MKKVGLASDHAGFELKEFVKTWLTEKGYPCKDFGTYSTESCDYADYAHPLALAIEAGECGPGVAICGSGEGISMTLNKHQGIRAALCWMPEIAHLSRQHNDANVLVMPGRFIDHEMAEKILDEFFNSGFEGGPGTVCSGHSTPRSPRATIIPSESLIISSSSTIALGFSSWEIINARSPISAFAARTSSAD